MGAPQAAGPSFVSQSDKAQIFGTQPPVQLITANNGKLYLYQQRVNSGGANIDGSGIYRSTDGGTTWTQLDSGNSLNNAIGSSFYDAANSQLILGLVQDDGSSHGLFLKNFNLTSETWGAN